MSIGGQCRYEDGSERKYKEATGAPSTQEGGKLVNMVTSEDHLRALLTAEPDDRVRAARLLLESLEDEPADSVHEAAWAEELTRRAEGIADGTRPTVDGDEALARVRARIDRLTR